MLWHTGVIKYNYVKVKENYRPTAVSEDPTLKQAKGFCTAANKATENALKCSLHREHSWKLNENLIFCFLFSKKISNFLPLHQTHPKEITLFSKLIFVQYKRALSATSFRTQGFFLCLSLSRSSLFIHTDLLACLPDFLFVGMHHS